MRQTLKTHARLWLTLVTTLACLSATNAHAHEPCPKQKVFKESEYTYQYFQGSIDEKYPFTMIVSNQEKGCYGAYSYDKYKQLLGLKGVCDTGKLELLETYFYEPEKNNKFVGQRNQNKVAGTWYDTKSKKSLPFNATQLVPEKRAVLTQAKGSYRLENIEGSCCANGLLDVYKEKGVWKASSSAISEGMRKGENIALSKKQKRSFSTAMLKVDDALNIRLYANGKLLATFPYTEKSVYQFTKKEVCDTSMESEEIAFLHGDNFYQEKLLIAMGDDEHDLGSYFIDDIWAIQIGEGAYSMEYYPLISAFNITFQNSNSGVSEQAALMFVRKTGSRSR